tara:strand:+ start:1170 stop:1466 length:297 start_codon:yes stop_codon:yes gene_type:complete
MNLPLKLALVTWTDASGGSSLGWRDISEVLSEAHPAKAVSVGYVLAETEDSIVICPHLMLDESGCPERGDGELVIPKGWVERVEYLPSAAKYSEMILP